MCNVLIFDAHVCLSHSSVSFCLSTGTLAFRQMYTDVDSDDSYTLHRPFVCQDEKTQSQIHGKHGSGGCVVLIELIPVCLDEC